MRARFFLPLPAILLVLAGCSQNKPTNTAPSPPSSPSVDAKAKLSVPAHVKHLASVPFTLQLTDRKTGSPISGMRVTVGLEMPSMKMPAPNVVRLDEQKPGIYTGNGIFTMAGKWQATAVYLDSSGNEGSYAVPVKVQ